MTCCCGCFAERGPVSQAVKKKFIVDGSRVKRVARVRKFVVSGQSWLQFEPRRFKNFHANFSEQKTWRGGQGYGHTNLRRSRCVHSSTRSDTVMCRQQHRSKDLFVEIRQCAFGRSLQLGVEEFFFGIWRINHHKFQEVECSSQQMNSRQLSGRKNQKIT